MTLPAARLPATTHVTPLLPPAGLKDPRLQLQLADMWVQAASEVTVASFKVALQVGGLVVGCTGQGLQLRRQLPVPAPACLRA